MAAEDDFDDVSGVEEPKLSALETLRHSTAHVMADAVKRLFPEAKITIGPAIETGFYYDFDVPRPFTEVEEELRNRGFRVDSDLSADKVGAKIRRAQLEKIPVMLVCGPKEVEQGAVAPRLRDGKQLEVMPLDRFAEWLGAESKIPRGGAAHA